MCPSPAKCMKLKTTSFEGMTDVEGSYCYGELADVTATCKKPVSFRELMEKDKFGGPVYDA